MLLTPPGRWWSDLRRAMLFVAEVCLSGDIRAYQMELLCSARSLVELTEEGHVIGERFYILDDRLRNKIH